jgi:hypothetical protein
MALVSKRIRVGSLIVVGCAAVTSIGIFTGASLASVGSHAHHPSTASSRRNIAAVQAKSGPVVVPKITYPAEGINVSASAPASPGRLAPPASSPKSVLTSLKQQIVLRHVLGAALAKDTPVVSLRVVTERNPESPLVTAGRPYVAWVVTYRNTSCLVLGPSKARSFPGCKFVGIMDASAGAWTDFFQTNH